MADVTLTVHGDLEVDDALREGMERRCHALSDEFHEITRVEVTLSTHGGGCAASGHVTGKNTDLAAHAQATEPGPASDAVLDQLRQQLRKTHDKRIFAKRRAARKNPPKKI
jgi:ribosome-associated translation inhibitor RaiA